MTTRQLACAVALGLALPHLMPAQERPADRHVAPWKRLPPDAIVLRVSRTGAVTLNDQPMATASLDSVLSMVFAPRPERVLYLVSAAGAPDTTRRRVARAAARARAELVPLSQDPRVRRG